MYNAPPVRVPRDEMWAAIQAKRAAGPRVVYGGGSVSPAPANRFGTKVWLGAAAAAMLLVATGVGIGRWTAPIAPRVATVVPVQPVVVGSGATQPSTVAGAESTAETQQVANSPGSDSDAGRNSGGSGRTVATTSSSRNGSAVTEPPVPSITGPTAASQITVANHLGQAEALLTSFKTRPNADQQLDAQLGAWARQLLSNTRLLLDSPIANDPQRRPLLEDLELVLVQIVQLSPGSLPQDREMIEKTLQQDNVITRLRFANPANAQRGG